MERPRHARPLRTSINTLFILLLGAAVGYSAYPVLNALRSEPPAQDDGRARAGDASSPTLKGEEPLDALIWPGRHLMIAVSGTALDDTSRALLAHVRPGAVILRAENLQSRDQVLTLIDDIKASTRLGASDTSLPLIAADLQGVDVQALGLQAAPAVATLASMGNVDTARKLGRSYASEYAQLGLAMVFTSMLDIYRPDSFVQQPETYDRDHAEATKMALAFLGGARDAGVIPIGRGFPGRGAAQAANGAVPALNHDRYQLAKIMYSFIEAVSGGDKVPAVVVEHVAVPALDDESRPASLSPVLVKTVLRQTCNYEGVVIAGDIALDPALASEPSERVAVQALVAGCDAVIVADPDPEVILDVCKAIQTAVFLYTLPSNQLASSKARLDSLQNWLRASERSGRGEGGMVANVEAPPPSVQPAQEIPTPPVAPPTIAITREDVPPVDEDLDGPIAGTEESGEVAAETPEPIDAADPAVPPDAEAPEAGLPEDAPVEHTVGENESLAAIANRYGVTVKNLLVWNALIDPQIEPGQVLRVAPPAPLEGEPAEDVDLADAGSADGDTAEPEAEASADAAAEPTTTHTVVAGDTLYRIAVRYNTTPEHIMKLNNLRDANVVVLGSRLKVPAPQ